MELPDGTVVDILTDVLEEISRWLQDDVLKPESGGYIVGYQNKDTKNIVLEKVSTPFALDKKSRVHFDMKDVKHKLFIQGKIKIDSALEK